ncbi:MAG: molybdate ABC transporter substrate-binding protein [Syntrophomonadaceae bacterium]|nr:molybdate ABC transporter substrate-binding protein [Syntrophomonadaceae bacterium]
MKFNKSIVLFSLLFAVILLVGCSKEPPAEEAVQLNVAAAASLQNAGKEIQELYIAEKPNVSITYNFASSGTLQNQIEEGAPADLFISAGVKQMDALAEKELIVSESRRDLLANDLILIAKQDSSLSDFADLTDSSVKKISIGTPETVPAGKYAQEALTSLELYDQILSKIVFAKDVRQVLTYVQTGNVDAGLVYRSDVYQEEDIVVVTAAPEDSHQPIVYPMAVIKASQNQAEAQAFAEFLTGQEASAVFSKYGFEPIQD